MQVLPFVFSLILVFFFLTSRLGSEERIDKKILASCFMAHKERLNLVKKAETYQMRTLRKPYTKSKVPEEKKKQVSHPYRPDQSMSYFNKLSLAFFLKKTDELTLQFAKRKLFDVLSFIYKERLSSELFEDMLTCFIAQKPQRLCNLDLKNAKFKDEFFLLLTDKVCPLEEILAVEPFKDNALCYFFFLRKDLFESLFPSSGTKAYLEKEYKMRCDCKSFILVKEKISPDLMSLAPEWTGVYLDQLLCFQAPSKKVIKASVKGEVNEFFYFPITGANEL